MKIKKIFVGALLIILLTTVAVYEKHVNDEHSKYNIQASSAKEDFDIFCENALGAFDENPIAFSDLQQSYTGFMMSMKVWARNHYAHWQNENLPYDITYEEEEGDPMMDIYIMIPELYNEIVNTCYLKEPEHEQLLTKAQAEKRVKELRSQMEIHFSLFIQ